jgi:hypothetical protein
MRQKMDEQFSNKNSPMVGNQKALDPEHIVNGKGMAAAHGVPSEQSYDQQRTLLQLSRADTWVPSNMF